MAKDQIQARTESEALARFLQEQIDPSKLLLPLGDSGKQVALLRDGERLEGVKKLLDEYRLAPERTKGTSRLTALASFVDHVNRFKDDGSALFADSDPKRPSLTCVYNYAAKATEPRFADHRAEYRFPLSKEWQAWMGQNEKPIASQEQFAQFLEERIADVAHPEDADGNAKEFAELLKQDFASPSRLLQLAEKIEINANVKVAKKLNLANGETQVMFVEEHEARDADKGGPVKIPGAFLINIPVFDQDVAPTMLPVRLRYRLSKDTGQLVWFYSVYGADKLFDDTFRARAADAAKQTDLQLFYGAPEA